MHSIWRSSLHPGGRESPGKLLIVVPIYQRRERSALVVFDTSLPFIMPPKVIEKRMGSLDLVLGRFEVTLARRTWIACPWFAVVDIVK